MILDELYRSKEGETTSGEVIAGMGHRGDWRAHA